jgi:Raf kinase inhibitor-like YbhB/YbcL family protein
MKLNKFKDKPLPLIFIYIPILCLILFNGGFMNFTITSNSFAYNQAIPARFTCDAENISPDLEWQNYPNQTKSFVLIIDDPDAPHVTWDHFVAFNIPDSINKVAIGELNALSNQAKIGENSWGKNNYGGPCPPSGSHRYFFKIYALDKMLDLTTNVTKADVLKAAQNHILAEAILMGRYQRIK